MEGQRRQRHSDSSRRTFRGRGGPRDGNLPRPRHPRRKKKAGGGAGRDPDDDGPTPPATPGEDGIPAAIATRNDDGEAIVVDAIGEAVDGDGGAAAVECGRAGDREVEGVEGEETVTVAAPVVSHASTGDDDAASAGAAAAVAPIRNDDDPSPRAAAPSCQEEERRRAEEERLKRLLLKIRNVRTTVRRSSGSLKTSLEQWRTNCLNPARNCVVSWRSIVRYRLLAESDNTSTFGGGAEDGGAVGEDVAACGACVGGAERVDAGGDEWSKEPSLAVFELMQAAMQSGPLAGAKPGYFKRCGSDAASTALSFLRDCSGTTDGNRGDSDGDGGGGATYGDDGGDGGGDSGEEGVEARLRRELRFTERQAAAVCKWMRDAERAASSSTDGGQKPPSKSVVKERGKQQRILEKKREVRSKKIAKARARREDACDSDGSDPDSDFD